MVVHIHIYMYRIQLYVQGKIKTERNKKRFVRNNRGNKVAIEIEPLVVLGHQKRHITSDMYGQKKVATSHILTNCHHF